MSRVYWITGLSGAGKTSLCKLLVQHLRGLGDQVIMLDGDELREAMESTKAHSRNERISLSKRYAHLCHLLSVQGFDVAIATISMFREVHEWNRKNLSGYTEIFLKVPLNELKRRDPKELYIRAERGEIFNVAGLDLEVDEPLEPDVCIDWHSGLTVEESLRVVITSLQLETKREN